MCAPMSLNTPTLNRGAFVCLPGTLTKPLQWAWSHACMLLVWHASPSLLQHMIAFVCTHGEEGLESFAPLCVSVYLASISHSQGRREGEKEGRTEGGRERDCKSLLSKVITRRNGSIVGVSLSLRTHMPVSG